MERKIEGTHIGFLRYITGKRVRRLGDVMWETPRAERVWEAEIMQSSMTYIGRRQATVAQWVEIRPLLEICVQGIRFSKGVGAGGRLGGAKRQQRNNFGPPWQESRRRLKWGGVLRRMPRSSIWRNVGGQVGKLEWWDGDRRCPGERMKFCGMHTCWDRDRGRLGGRMNSSGS